MNKWVLKYDFLTQTLLDMVTRFNKAPSNTPTHTNTHTSSELRSAKSTHQVFGRSQSLQPVQGQEVSRVLVCELGGLLQAPLLVQDGFIPDGELTFLRFTHGVRM